MTLVRFGVVVAIVASTVRPAVAQSATASSAPKKENTSKAYDDQYASFLASARVPSTKNLWITGLIGDSAARRQNDLVTIKVEEAVSASGATDLTVGKKTNASASLPSPAATVLSKFLPANSETKSAGSGSTSRTTTLSAMLTGRVTEVLPSGDLVIEGVREIDINGDRQLVVLTGIIRVYDILPGNIAPSSRIGQLRIRCLSQGVMHDSLTPGWLIRVLNKIF